MFPFFIYTFCSIINRLKLKVLSIEIKKGFNSMLPFFIYTFYLQLTDMQNELEGNEIVSLLSWMPEYE